MTSFNYTITAPAIHARPAGALVKVVKPLDSDVVLVHGSKRVSAAKVIAIMSLGIKQGETLTVELTGGDEAGNMAVVEKFFRDNL